MKKINKVSIYILVLVILSSCSSTPKIIVEALSNSKFNNTFADKETSRIISDNEYPFTLNYKDQYGCPIINLTIENKKLTFLVDTGSERSWLFENGLNKLYGSVEKIENDNMNWYINYLQKTDSGRLKNKSIKKIQKMLHEDVLKYKIVFTINHPFFNFIYNPKYENIDGIIGQDYLQTYKTVTFNFIRNTISFNQNKLGGYKIPFVENESECKYIEFSYKGKKEYGLIDTGNYTFSPRNNFGKDQIHFDFEFDKKYSVSYLGKVKKRFPSLLTFNDIKIGNIIYNEIKGVYSNIWFSSYNKGAQNLLQVVNGIGCEFFRNHIIQFDYEEKVFSIL